MNFPGFLILFGIVLPCSADVVKINQPSGLVNMPEGNGKYPANFSRRWEITTPNASAYLELEIISFNVEGYPPPVSCDYDYFLVIPGSSAPYLRGVCSSNNIVAPNTHLFCNDHISQSLPLKMNVGSSVMIIEFCTDAFIELSGVQFAWSTVSNPPTPSQPTTTALPTPSTTPKPYLCGNSISLSTGQSTSIVFPKVRGPYPNNAHCTWNVKSSTGEIYIQTNFFDVEGYTSACYFDYLEVSGTGLPNRTYCGNIGPNLKLTAKSLTIAFISDNQIARLGFNLNISAPLGPTMRPTNPSPVNSKCGTTFTLSSATDFAMLYSPGWPNTYSRSTTCYWNIINSLYSQNQTILFMFMSFETEPTYDQLTITDVNGAMRVFEGKLPNNTAVRVYSPTANINFNSDSTVTRAGFAIKVSVTPKLFTCSAGQFRCKSGQQCIPMGEICDKIQQCNDGSDETDLWCQMANVCGTSTVSPNIDIPTPSTDIQETAVEPVNDPVLILNGSPSKPGSWPWTVGLYVKFVTVRQFCGGALIAPHWVVTAASCLEVFEPQILSVDVGSYHRVAMDPPYQFNTNVTKIIKHPLFNSHSFSHDVAMVRLSKDVPFPFNAHINSICLPLSGAKPVPGAYCVATGWGDTSGTGDDHLLQQAALPIVSQNQCSANYSNTDSSQFCAGPSSGKTATCQGDSGGPLACKNTAGKWVLTGMTSFRPGCGQGKPGLYSSISSFLPFIYQTMAEND